MDKLKKDIIKILANCEKIEEFDGREIFFLKEKEFMALWKMREEEIKRLIKEGYNEDFARKTALKEYFKILNPKPQPMKLKSYGYHLNYSIVRDKEKIFNNYDIERDFYRWANRERKMIKEWVEKYAKNVQDAHNWIEFVEKKIKNAEEKMKELLSNPDKYEIIRTDVVYRGDKAYVPVIYARYMEESKSIPLYIRDKVPNIFWELKTEPPRKKKEIKILKELESFENPFHYYYIKKKEG